MPSSREAGEEISYVSHEKKEEILSLDGATQVISQPSIANCSLHLEYSDKKNDDTRKRTG
jgi:hypothetical protein